MYKVYKVNVGDSLDSIANAFGTTTQELININGITSNQPLVVGSLLVVPTNFSNTFNKYIVKKGDNIYSIAQNYNISPSHLLKLNGLSTNDYIYPGEELVVPSSDVKFYITESDDTIEKVTKALNTDIDKLMEQNNEMFLVPDQLIVYKMNG